MAKKTVATLQKKDAKGYAKVIKAVRSPKTGDYKNREEIVIEEKKKKKKKKK